MTDAYFISDPIFDSFTLRLKPGYSGSPEALAEQVLAEALDDAEGWSARPVHASLPLLFDLLPAEEGALTVKQAWDLTYALRNHAGVLEAEPAFETVLDNVADPDEIPEDLAESDLAEILAQAVLEEDEDEEPINDDLLFESAAQIAGPAALNDDDPLWCPKLVMAPAAWERTPRPGTGAQRGEGIVIGHPDAGFREHDELFSSADERVLLEQDRNFVERDRPDNAQHEDAGHGLATASVIMSLDNPLGQEAVVWGSAPAASIIPFRVAKKRFLVPVPVLLASGVRRLREAILVAMDEGCHVISISLGWLWNGALHEVIKEAFFNDIIICAAAGNYVRFVVWPAHYPETIAVAGCTARRTKWKGSSRGKRVDVTAPAKRVWKATRKGERRIVTPSKGTSYSVATTAGLAALWLAHWGRDHLLETYGGRFTLTTVFRTVLKATCDPPPPNDRGKFGSGIVNADRLLAAPLPTVDELSASTAPDAESAFAAPATMGMRSVRAFTEIFEGVGETALREDLAGMLEVDENTVDTELASVGDELMFHMVTNPALRENFLPSQEAPAVSPGEVDQGLLLTEESAPTADLRGRFLDLDVLSENLRGVAE